MSDQKAREKATEVYRKIEERCVTCMADECRDAGIEFIEQALLTFSEERNKELAEEVERAHERANGWKEDYERIKKRWNAVQDDNLALRRALRPFANMSECIEQYVEFKTDGDDWIEAKRVLSNPPTLEKEDTDRIKELEQKLAVAEAKADRLQRRGDSLERKNSIVERYNPDDEIVAYGYIHFERMDDGLIWMNVAGHDVNFRLEGRGKIKIEVSDEPALKAELERLRKKEEGV